MAVAGSAFVLSSVIFSARLSSRAVLRGLLVHERPDGPLDLLGDAVELRQRDDATDRAALPGALPRIGDLELGIRPPAGECGQVAAGHELPS